MHKVLEDLGLTAADILALPVYEQEEILKLVDAYDHQKSIEECRTNFLAFARKMWHVVEGAEYIEGRHHRKLAEVLDRVAEGKSKRVAISLPPRHTKSCFVSKLFPAYLIGRNASSKIIQACNVKNLADGFGSAVRSLLMDPLYQEIFPQTVMDKSSTAKGDWATTKSGKYYAVGVGGTMTGQGADCLSGETLIETDAGIIRIDSLHELVDKPLVLSFDHTTGKKVWSKVLASRVIENAETYTVRTTLGRKLVGTADHRVFVRDKGYTQIGALCVGDRVLVSHADMGEGLSGQSGFSVSRDVQNLQRPFCEIASRFEQSRTQRFEGSVLFAPLRPSRSCNQEQAQVRDVRNSCAEKDQSVLSALSNSTKSRIAKIRSDILQSLRSRISGSKFKTRVLRSGMCGQSAQPSNVGCGKLTFQECVKSIGLVFQIASDYFRARQLQMCGLRPAGEESPAREDGAEYPAYPPPERESGRQPSRELGDALSEMPQQAPQEIWDTVSVAAEVRGWREPVYDIQVEGTSNFFAGSILVHNCAILDDLHDEREAVIGLVRPEIYDSTFDWYKSGPRQRLQPGGAIIIVMTRWSKRDVIGQILADDKDGEWEVVEFPAILPSGNPLWPEFWSLEELLKVKANIGTMRWNAQYMQKPTAVELALVKPGDWKPWSGPKGEHIDPPRCTFVVQSWDTAHSAKKHANPSACTTWGIAEVDKRPAIVLLHAWQDRVEFPDLKAKAKEMYKEWKPDAVIIESQASGRPLISEMRVSGIPAIEFKAQSGVDKITRVNAVTDLFTSGFIYYVPSHDTNDVITQFAEFPAGALDDLVDSSTAALDLLKRQINEYRREEAEDDDEEDVPYVKKRLHRRYY